MRKALLATAALALAVGLLSAGSATAASHREAPLIANDPTADITDFFMFRSYEDANPATPAFDDPHKVVLIMDVIPGEEPSAGPNYYNFDPNVVYSFNIDNNRDGVADDLRLDFRFTTEFRGVTSALKLPLSYVGGLGPIPKIDSLDSAGIGLRQTYTVSLAHNGEKNGTPIATGKVAVPSRVGPRTMGSEADYNALAAQGLYDLGNGIRVFAGQRDDPFYIDLGAVFDSLNLRSLGATGGVDMLSGFNVHEIAVELPTSMISGGSNVIGAYASTSRPQTTVRGDEKSHGDFVQVQRLANPLVNEVIIGTVDKDRWNATEPEDESQFIDYYRKPRVSLALQLASGLNTSCLLPPAVVPDCRPASTTPEAAVLPGLDNFNRTDLVALLLQYNGVLYGSGGGGAVSDLLRLNVGIDPKPLGTQDRLGVVGGDLAGWPNGRRPRDDVTDIAVEAAGGSNYAGVGDGVSANDVPLPAAFPFLAVPADGRNRSPNPHVNP